MGTYIFVHRDGTEEEKPFLIKKLEKTIVIPGDPEILYKKKLVEVEYLSPHISRQEFDRGLGGGRAFGPTVELFEKVRYGIQRPIPVNSFWRSIKRQWELWEADLAANGGKPSGKVARPDSSPHPRGTAMDLGIPQGWSTERFADLLIETSVGMGFDKARVGHKKYGNTFVHLDLDYLLYKPYTDKKNPNPGILAPGVRW